MERMINAQWSIGEKGGSRQNAKKEVVKKNANTQIRCCTVCCAVALCCSDSRATSIVEKGKSHSILRLRPRRRSRRVVLRQQPLANELTFIITYTGVGVGWELRKPLPSPPCQQIIGGTANGIFIGPTGSNAGEVHVGGIQIHVCEPIQGSNGDGRRSTQTSGAMHVYTSVLTSSTLEGSHGGGEGGS